MMAVHMMVANKWALLPLTSCIYRAPMESSSIYIEVAKTGRCIPPKARMHDLEQLRWLYILPDICNLNAVFYIEFLNGLRSRCKAYDRPNFVQKDKFKE